MWRINKRIRLTDKIIATYKFGINVLLFIILPLLIGLKKKFIIALPSKAKILPAKFNTINEIKRIEKENWSIILLKLCHLPKLFFADITITMGKNTPIIKWTSIVLKDRKVYIKSFFENGFIGTLKNNLVRRDLFKLTLK